MSWRYNEATAVADNIFKVTGSSCSYLAVTLLSLHDISLSGEALFEAPKKDRTMCGLFVSVGNSAQFSHLRHRIAVMERGCYLSQTKQSGELFCRGDTMRQRQLPTTYSKSQVRAARTSQSPFCHSMTFPCQGKLCLRRQKKIARCAAFLFLSATLHSSLTCDIALQ